MAHLDGFAIFGGIVFLVVIALVLYPVSFRLPRPISQVLRRIGQQLRLLEQEDCNAAKLESHDLSTLSHTKSDANVQDEKNHKVIRVRIGLSSAPLLGVLLLLITTSIGGEQIKLGIAGADGVRPYDVLVLFICLAYIATALDATGGLRFVAFKVALRARSGYQLYFYLYFFFFLAGAIIGNDPIVLSGTPFLAYLAKVSGVSPPTAWIFAQFLAANLSSAILVSSVGLLEPSLRSSRESGGLTLIVQNPTNVLIAGAFDLNFLSDFTKMTVVPAVAAAVVVYPVLFYGFKSLRTAKLLHPTTSDGSLIPRVFVQPDVNPRAALVDPQGAVFHSVLLLVTLAVLVGTSFAKGVHVWAVTLAGGGIGVIRDFLFDYTNGLKNARKNISSEKTLANGVPTNIESLDNVQNTDLSSHKVSMPLLWRRFKGRFPNLATTLSRLPWPLLPFAVGMFILVQSLDRFGYIEIFAGWTANACSSPAAAIYFVGTIVAFGLCPLCGTNIGATILAVQVLKHPNFQQARHVQEDERILRGGLFAVAIASNTGALTSFPSSLAGLLWRRILSEKGIRTSQRSFSLINAIPGLIITYVALSIVLVEILYWPA